MSDSRANGTEANRSTAATGSCADGGRVSSAQAYHLLEVGGVLLVDIRSPVELFHSGSPEGAKNVTTESPNFVDYLLEELDGDKSRPVALICATGKRSKAAKALLEAEGFENVTDVYDGMFGNESCGPGWVGEGLPTKPFA